MLGGEKREARLWMRREKDRREGVMLGIHGRKKGDKELCMRRETGEKKERLLCMEEKREERG